MEQRLGRVARMGSQHERVFSYVIRPPAGTETLIHLERVLRDKVKESSQIVDVFPSLSLTGDSSDLENTPRVSEAIRSILEEWVHHASGSVIGGPCFAAVAAPIDGFVALCEADDALSLIAGTRDGLGADPGQVLQMMKLCEGNGVWFDEALIDKAVSAVRRHFDGLRITEGARSGASAHIRRLGLKRISRIVGRARPHDRARIASLASRARSSLMSRIGAEGERRLEFLATQSISDDHWMQEIAEIGIRRSANSGEVKVHAAILLVAHDETVTRAMKR